MPKLSNTNNPRTSDSVTCFCMSYVKSKIFSKIFLAVIEKVSTSYHSEQRS